ncbi:hypothetical protein BJY00DRAFT_187698 [Aspergillus carlsbadensis]|nr:hypothetical protein BJY00DRAFT_187698 [Aspergillus carlsbadensis]
MNFCCDAGALRVAPITPLPNLFTYFFSFFISSCVCRNESKISEINSPRRLRRTTKKEYQCLCYYDKRDDLAFALLFGPFVYGATCICLMLIYLYFIFFFFIFSSASCRFLYLYFFTDLESTPQALNTLLASSFESDLALRLFSM